MTTPPPHDRERLPGPEERNVGLIREMWELIRHNKKWWLAPIILALLAIGVLAVLGSSSLAPFLYPLF